MRGAPEFPSDRMWWIRDVLLVSASGSRLVIKRTILPCSSGEAREMMAQ